MPSIEVTILPNVDRAITEKWLAQMKRMLPDSSSDDDVIFTEAIIDAYDWIEDYLRRSLLKQTLSVFFDAGEARGGRIDLPGPPVRSASSITSVTTYDLDDNATTVPSADYRLEGSSGAGAYVLNPVLVAVNSGWTLERSLKAVRVVYVAGYGDGADGEHASVPRKFVRALLRKAAVYFEEPVSQVAGTIVSQIESPESMLLGSVFAD